MGQYERGYSTLERGSSSRMIIRLIYNPLFNEAGIDAGRWYGVWERRWLEIGRNQEKATDTG
jgi:hypothetical protein